MYVYERTNLCKLNSPTNSLLVIGTHNAAVPVVADTLDRRGRREDKESNDYKIDFIKRDRDAIYNGLLNLIKQSY